jgi:hypothetical protein
MARHSSVVTRSRPTASSYDAVEAELSRLASADRATLQRRWRTVFGRPAPDLPRALLYRILAYRIQADAAGDLDPAVVRLLERLGRGEVNEIPLPELRAVKPGTLLVREWEGALQRVMVLEEGPDFAELLVRQIAAADSRDENKRASISLSRSGEATGNHLFRATRARCNWGPEFSTAKLKLVRPTFVS